MVFASMQAQRFSLQAQAFKKGSISQELCEKLPLLKIMHERSWKNMQALQANMHSEISCTFSSRT